MGRMVLELVEVILDRAEREMDLLMPGYTHLQRGQVGENLIEAIAILKGLSISISFTYLARSMEPLAFKLRCYVRR